MKKYCIINSLLIVFFSIFIGSCVENIVNLDEDDVKDIPQDIVSPYYVPIDWDSTELIENDSVSGKVILSLTPQTEMISEGSVISIIDPLNPGIKIITKAIRNGETIQLEKIKGDLTNIPWITVLNQRYMTEDPRLRLSQRLSVKKLKEAVTYGKL